MHVLLRSLAVRGHDVRVWTARCMPGDAPRVIDGVRAAPITEAAAFEADVREADVVVSQNDEVPAAAESARRHGKPFVVTCHLPAVRSRQFTDLPGHTALAVVNSYHMLEVAQEHFARRGGPDQVVVVRGPVFAEQYATVPGDRVTLVNLNAGKGGELFWALAERLPAVRFLGVRGAYGTQVVREAPNVEVLDHMPSQLMRDHVYARTRVLLVPTDHEAWSRSGVEAMASGIPVLAHPSPGVRESLGGAGVFADRQDLGAWERALVELLAPENWQRASHKARERSAELDPAAELAGWVAAVERLAG
ncbi:glycosyltransferase family 4 protein [Kitasatospora viridis]|nr:glycosyltransferase family 4 protein [Kitasatospora viridis]